MSSVFKIEVGTFIFKDKRTDELIILSDCAQTTPNGLHSTERVGSLYYLSVSESKFDIVLFIIIMVSKDQDEALDIWNPHLKGVFIRGAFKIVPAEHLVIYIKDFITLTK